MAKIFQGVYLESQFSGRKVVLIYCANSLVIICNKNVSTLTSTLY